MNLSPQQATAIDWVKNGSGNAILVAVAGAGKTTTLLKMVGALPSGATAALVAYNKAIATEIKEKVSSLNLPAEVGTVHAFGFAALRKARRNLKVDGKKVRNLCDAFGVPAWYRDVVSSLVSHAKLGGIGPLVADTTEAWVAIFDHHDLVLALPEVYRASEDAVATAIGHARRVLAASNNDLSVIDFDDMCYLPLVLDLPMDTYDFVLLDEAQDTNETRRALVRRMVAEGGRFVAVGDPAQAIYGFTGADADSLERIKRDFNAIELPLTVTYRCPKAVVAVAQQWVSHISAADAAPEGVYRSISSDQFSAETLTPEDAILCRKTAPLISLAYSLIKKGTACRVEGRSIGDGLLKLIRKWKTAKTIGQLLSKIDKWEAAESAKALKQKKEERVAAIVDQAECVRALAEGFPIDEAVSVLAARVEQIFGDTVGTQTMLTLATIHRSKGREWSRVYWLGRNAWQPSKFAKQPWQMQQEQNLMYVAATRAKRELVEVEV